MPADRCSFDPDILSGNSRTISESQPIVGTTRHPVFIRTVISLFVFPSSRTARQLRGATPPEMAIDASAEECTMVQDGERRSPLDLEVVCCVCLRG